MARRSLNDRMGGIPPADYERAYAYLVGPIRAGELVREMLARLETLPGDDIVFDPKFIALLALFSPEGRHVAEAVLPPAVVTSHQRELAARHESIRTEFPDILAEGD
jgi:hypothetical protein